MTTAREVSAVSASAALLAGLARYRRDTAAQLRPLMGRLAAGQHPHSMLLTCSDSRVVPHLFTGSDPGDIFTVQNVGNLVYGPSVEAAVAYARGVLGVGVLAVCGHSGCGAMHGLCAGGAAGAVGDWLRGGAGALAAWRSGRDPVAAPSLPELTDQDRLALTNVVVQLDALRALPGVGAAEQEGSVALLGLFLHIPTGEVLVHDAVQSSFH